MSELVPQVFDALLQEVATGDRQPLQELIRLHGLDAVDEALAAIEQKSAAEAVAWAMVSNEADKLSDSIRALALARYLAALP